MNINELMNKPLWQMTGEEFLAIINEKKPAESAPAPTDREINPAKYYVYGLAGIARLFGCSIPTANPIKKSGVTRLSPSVAARLSLTRNLRFNLPVVNHDVKAL